MSFGCFGEGGTSLISSLIRLLMRKHQLKHILSASVLFNKPNKAIYSQDSIWPHRRNCHEIFSSRHSHPFIRKNNIIELSSSIKVESNSRFSHKITEKKRMKRAAADQTIQVMNIVEKTKEFDPSASNQRWCTTNYHETLNQHQTHNDISCATALATVHHWISGDWQECALTMAALKSAFLYHAY